MKNTGCLVANDSNKERCKPLNANLQRLGVRNAIVTNHDGRAFPKVMGGFNRFYVVFLCSNESRVLLDAPCTGLGIIARDPSAKLQKVT